MTELPHHTLSRLLRDAGLERMADAALKGHYHDYLSDLALPELQLLQDLDAAINIALHGGNLPKYDRLNKIRYMHLNGAFDATPEEADAWAASPDGQEAFALLGVTPAKGDNDG